MADDEDIQALLSGDPDMVRRDFQSADLIGTDASMRNFSEALLKSVNFTNANLQGANLTQANTLYMILRDANCNSLHAPRTVFHSVLFERANLRDCKLHGSTFIKCNFDGADLRGGNFKLANFNEGCTFKDCIVDDRTDFDGAKIIRAMAREPAFRYYEVNRGVLSRKSIDQPYTHILEENSSDELLAQALSEIADLEKSLGEFKTDTAPEPRHAGIGHNNPPVDTPFEQADYDETQTVLETLKSELRTERPNNAVIEDANSKLSAKAQKIVSWVSQKADLAADNFAEEAGKSLAHWRTWVALWMVFSGKLSQLIDLLTRWLL